MSWVPASHAEEINKVITFSFSKSLWWDSSNNFSLSVCTYGSSNREQGRLLIGHGAKTSMYILGIDTSCDDTCASVVKDGCQVLSNIVHSQVKLHHPHGGVVPELASRAHLRNILPVVKAALDKACISVKDLDGIAVTIGPGLIGSLLVGLYYAKALSYSHHIKMVAINHLEGHILSIFLEEKQPAFPFISLTVSGGHTSLYHVTEIGKYEVLGRTLDDAAGEAFDKVSKILGLGYPGGPIIEKFAKQGDPHKIPFPRAYMSRDSLDFSFSGVKTAVALYIKKWGSQNPETLGVTKYDIAASFQESVVEVLVKKALLAQERKGAKCICVSGGVACNGRLRKKLMEECKKKGIQVFWPRPEYCTDNGAMIALAGYHRILKGETADYSLDVRSRFPIEDIYSQAQKSSQ